jgi:hypothetical protein
MKTKPFFFLLIVGSLFCSWHASSQPDPDITGKFSAIKEAGQINLVFQYDQMQVGSVGKEETYINKRMSEYEAKNPGKGDDWLVEWKEIKRNAEEVFAKALNKKLSKKYGTMVGQDYPDAEYTFVVNFITLEIGWSGGFVSGSGMAFFYFKLCKTADLDNAIGKMVTYGMADMESVKMRMAGIYQNAANRITKILEKNVQK